MAQGHTLRNHEVICRVVLIGTYVTTISTLFLLWASLALNHNPQALQRIVVCSIALVYVLFTHWLLRRGQFKVVAYLLVFFYESLATSILWSWGINTPIGLLIFGLVIVLSGILLTARHSLFAAVVSCTIMIGLQTFILFGWYQPDTSWTGNNSSFGDVFGYSVVFGMLALISWLYNREMERSLTQAKLAEAALLQQKATLKLQVKKRTAELRRAQLKEMQQLYRFIDLGQLGVTLIHDLANHLTALTLEIEGLRSKQQSKDIARAREITQYLEGLVKNTRDRLHGGARRQTFNIIEKLDETITFLRYKAAKQDVVINWHPPKRSWRFTGDPAYLSQAIAIITNNAIDAYGPITHNTERRVSITIERTRQHIIIKIGDWGRGVTKADRRYLFKPFHSTKKSGLGLGLFIAKQTVETSFGGTILLNQRSDHTEFVIKLPLKYE